MTELRIAPDLALPVDAVTQAMAILARRGAGKTHTASVLVEEVVKAQQPVVVLDPTGAWWGLRSSADGKEPGLPVVILGGEHGDVPLEPTAGKEIADVVIEHPGAFVIDLSGFESKRAELHFVADFLERLYRGKAKRRDPLLVVVDEADGYAPQRPGTEQLRSLGALESIVRRGRIRGMGVLLISQRSAVLNKNVLTQTEVLIAMQTTAPQDRAAIDEWIKGNGTADEREAVLGSLASLERGEAWVWSPAWLRILQRVRIRRRETFDSSRTPEAGEQAIEPRAFAPVDLEQLGARIVATREQARANDPDELKKRIRELEREASARPAETKVETVVERVEVPVLNGQVEHLASILREMHEVGSGLVLVGTGIAGAAQSITDAIARVQTATPSEGAGAGRARRVAGPSRQRPQPATDGSDSQNVASARPVKPPAPREMGDAPLGKAERSILAALVQYPQGRSQKQAAILTGYSSKGGGFRNALGRLRSLGYMEGGGDSLRITEAGRDAAGDTTPLPTGRELLEHWMGQLGKAERLALEALANAYPGSLTQEELGAATGYEPRGGGFRNALGKLRTLELIEGTGAALRASADLVDA